MVRDGSTISSPSSTAALAPSTVKVSSAEATAKPPTPPAKRGRKLAASTRGRPAPTNTNSATNKTPTMAARIHIASLTPKRFVT
jgi:hypothetical protein